VSAWLESNQLALGAAIDRIASLLETGEGRAARRPADPEPLERLAATFRLSDFERDLLLLAAGRELEPRIAARCAALHGEPWPTLGLALAVLPGGHWSALLPAGPLRRYKLIELAAGDVLTRRALSLPERVLHHLIGLDDVSVEIAPLLAELGVPRDPAPHQARLAERVERAVCDDAPPVIEILGGDPADRRAAAALACHARGLRPYALRAGEIAPTVAAQEPLARAWEREAALGAAMLVIECEGVLPASAASFVERLETRAIVSAGAADPLQRGSARVLVAPSGAPEQRAIWRRALGADHAALAREVEAVSAQFQLDTVRIDAACAQVRAALPSERPAVLWSACKSLARRALDDVAQRIETRAEWDDLILPDAQHAMLREIVDQFRQRTRVHEEWGFAGKSARGLGLAVMFHGPSGTGKTLAAEVIARALELDLYRIDLSAVVSKYIGETEKNLRRVFDAAEDAGAVLVFDEADALFGHRSEVHDSHDRHANIEVSYLLQRMEAYRGIAILTTNARKAIDRAFLRRLRFVVSFPFPDEEQRARIWRRVFPHETPTAALDSARLARLDLSGGHIFNVALNAAYLAAANAEPVTMDHLMRAARSELAKLDKSVAATEPNRSPGGRS
jgi:hypothetical protein